MDMEGLTRIGQMIGIDTEAKNSFGAPQTATLTVYTDEDRRALVFRVNEQEIQLANAHAAGVLGVEEQEVPTFAMDRRMLEAMLARLDEMDEMDAEEEEEEEDYEHEDEDDEDTLTREDLLTVAFREALDAYKRMFEAAKKRTE